MPPEKIAGSRASEDGFNQATKAGLAGSAACLHDAEDIIGWNNHYQ